MTSKVPPVVAQAFEYARKQLSCDLNGACLEASVLMHKFLKHRGVPAQLRRYESKDYGGHWTVITPYGEFDPTIGYWPEAAAWGHMPELVVVQETLEPYSEWDLDLAVDEAAAYETAAVDP